MSDQLQETVEEPDFDSMSDEEFMNQTASFESPSPAEPEQVEAEPVSGNLEDRLGLPEGVDQDDDPDAIEDADLGKAAAQPQEDGAKPADATAEAAAVTSEEDHTTPKQPEASEPLNYEQLFKQVMAPFKANGKDFAPSSPEEAVRLMQMGANYTKKMQSLQPNLKLMRMLENNGLLEESKLAFLIDLDKKNPKAIQKLLHDGKVDPLELDVSSEPVYKPGNHQVSDQEMQFHEVLSDVSSTQSGQETIVLINKWDQASKQAVYKEPALLSVINEQRANGIYDRICAEIDRQQTLGQLSNIPFIQAYKQVGDRLHASGQLALQSPSPQAAIQEPVTPSRQVLETRPAVPRKQLNNGSQARAASPGPSAATKSTPREFDPFTMTDAEIMAITAPRI